MDKIQIIEGTYSASGIKLAIVASRFNNFIVEHLIAGAIDYIVRTGGNKESITLIRVPGAFEIPIVCKKLAFSKKYEGIIALGSIIRGATSHFEYVASEATKGLAYVSLDSGVPVSFGILTTDTIEQAVERAGSKAGNKGSEAAAAAIETIHVLKQI